MSTPIRWGILATGGIAATFVEDLRLLPDAEVVAVGSRTLPAAKAFADRYGIAAAHGSWAELAADPTVDVVYVATPHPAHVSAALTCVEAGKAVLVEKPIAMDVASASTLIDAARANGVFLMEAMWTGCLPAIRQVVERVRRGEIGRVTAVHADFGLNATFDPASRLFDPQLGGGALLDLGIYPITFAHLMLGPPDSIMATAHLGSTGVDENTAIVLGYDSGAMASLSCSLVGDSPRRASVTGTAGRIELPRGFFHTSEYTLVPEPGQGAAPAEVTTVSLPSPGLGYHHEATEVHRCLREGLLASPLVPHEQTMAVMATLDAVRERIGLRY